MPRKPPKRAKAEPVIDLREPPDGIELAWDVVIVEDDPGVQRLVEATLTAAGLSVVAVVDRAEDVFPLLLSHHPDLVILDDELAGALRGSFAAASIKRSLPSVRIVFYSASAPEVVPPGVDLVCPAKTPKALMDAVRAVLEP